MVDGWHHNEQKPSVPLAITNHTLGEGYRFISGWHCLPINSALAVRLLTLQTVAVRQDHLCEFRRWAAAALAGGLNHELHIAGSR
jgi:hypothetical protein